MLSRVADNLFWMSRYLERGEQIARALDTTFHLELDLHGVLAEPAEMEWSALLRTLKQPPLPVLNEGDAETPLIQRVGRWLTLDTANGASIMTCINRSRNNARSVRGSISPGMWRELNKLYWQLADEEFRSRVSDSPHDFCEAVLVGGQLFHGICYGTLTHDEGWHFIQLGKYLERAERILNILEAKYQLLEGLDFTDLSLVNVQWGAVLKSCQAYEDYQRLHISRIEPSRVVEFLLLHPDFPHSVRFCLIKVVDSLRAISGDSSYRSECIALKTAGRLLSDLTYREMPEILENGLPEFLHNNLNLCSQVTRGVLDQYTLH